MVFNPANAVSEQEADAIQTQTPKVDQKIEQVAEQTQVAQTQGRFNPATAVGGAEAQKIFAEQQGTRSNQETIQQVTSAGEALGVPEAIAKPIGQYVIQPLFELGRGSITAGSETYGKLTALEDLSRRVALKPYEKLGAVKEFLDRTTGVDSEGFLNKWSKGLGNAAQEIPETDLSKFDKWGLQLIGAAPVIMTEFATVEALGAAMGLAKAPGYLKTLFEKMSDPSKFAFLGALQSYSKDPERKLSSLGEGAAVGVIMSGLLAAGGDLAGGLHKMTKAGWRAALSWVSGSPRAAARLVKNPKLMNTNPFGKVKTTEDVIDENQLLKQAFDKDAAAKKAAFKTAQKTESHLHNKSVSDAEFALTQALSGKKEALKTKQGFDMKTAANDIGRKFSRLNNAIKDKAVNIYDSTLKRFVQVKDTAGKAVENAVIRASNRNPGAVVPYQPVSRRVGNLMKKEDFPYSVSRTGELSDPTGTASVEEMGRLQKILDTLRERKNDGGLSLMYLQKLKTGTSSLSHSLFGKKGGDKTLARFYADLSEAVDPGKIVTRNPSLARSVHEIADANARYANLVPKYEAAMKHYYTKDNGKWVPSPEKARSAIAGKNKVVLREMELADSALPKSDRILPKMKDLDAAMVRNEIKQKDAVEKFSRQLAKDMKKLETANSKALRRLKQSNKKMTVEQKQKATEEIRIQYQALKDEERQLTNMLNERRKFHQDQELLRRGRASTTGLAGTAQSVAAFGTLGIVGAIKGEGRLLSVPALASVLGLSPIAVANMAKAGIGVSSVLDTVAKNQNLQRVVGAELLRNLIDKKGKDKSLLQTQQSGQ